MIDMKGNSDVKNLIKMIIYDGNFESEDEDQEDDLVAMEVDDLKILQRADTESSFEEVEESIGEIDLEIVDNMINNNQKQRYDHFMKKFADLITILNAEYTESDELEFTESNVRLLLSMAFGVFDNFNDFEIILAETHGQDCPIDVNMAKEILAITSGNYDNVLDLEFQSPRFVKNESSGL